MKAIACAVLGSLAIGSVSAIIGGDVVPAGSKTYMAFLSVSKTGPVACGATLISKNAVVTAASCVGDPPTYVTIGSHTSKASDTADVIEVESIRIHPKYNFTSSANDIAVVKLKKNSKYSPVKLPASSDSSKTVTTGDTANIAGWGSTKWVENFGVSDQLRSLDMKVLRNEDCRERSGFDYLDINFMCAVGKTGTGTAYSDVGGALILENGPGEGDNVAIGVLYYPQLANMPSLFIRFSSVVNWVKEQL